MSTNVLAAFGTLIAFLPLVWVALLHVRGQRRDVAYWWLALAFGVSGVVDALGYITPEAVTNRLSDLYPVLQSAIVSAVFLSRGERWIVALSLIATGVLSLALSVAGMDLVLATIASLVVCAVVYDHPEYGALRTSLLIYFGLVLACLYVAHVWPHRVTGVLYHGTRALGLAWFCWAAWRPTPQLGVVR